MGGTKPARMQDEDALWHATPLHYLPRLLASGALLSQGKLAEAGDGVRPRPTAAGRVRRLGLAGFVHLSLVPRTPLLADKRAKGYPHALLRFDRAGVLALPGAALLKFNTKAWRHRDDFVPVKGGEAMAALLEEHAAGRYPSLEVLAAGGLPLSPLCRELHVASEPEAAWVRGLLGEGVVALPRGVAFCLSPGLFPAGSEPDLTPLVAYSDACRAAGAVLPPPDLPFD